MPGAELKYLGDHIPRELIADVIFTTIRGLFLRSDVHITQILTILIYETLNIRKIRNYFTKLNSRV